MTTANRKPNHGFTYCRNDRPFGFFVNVTTINGRSMRLGTIYAKSRKEAAMQARSLSCVGPRDMLELILNPYRIEGGR